MRRILRLRAIALRLVFPLLIGALVSACSSTRTYCECIAPDLPPLNFLAAGQAGSDVGSIDPAHVTGALEYDMAQTIFPPLVTLDANLKPIDWAAEKHEVSKDGLTWTFHLRPNLIWSDSTPITASTYAYSLNRTLDPCIRSEVAGYLFSIQDAAAFHASACPAGARQSAQTLVGSSITAVDSNTLQVKVSAPDPSFLFGLTTPGAWAVPQQLIAVDPDHWMERLTNGTGFGGNIFKLTEWDHAGHLKFAANDKYWGDSKPILQHVNFTLYPDSTRLTDAFSAGKGDVAIAPAGNPSEIRKLQGYQAIPTFDLTYLIPNWRLAPFDDLRMRQALSLAIDRSALLHDAALGVGLPTFHIVPEGLPEYTAKLRDSADRTGNAALTSTPEKALTLAQSYANSNCGGVLSACPPITLTYADAPDQRALAHALVAQWTRVLPGVQIGVRAADPPMLDQAARSSQLTLTAWRADLPDALETLLSRLRTGGAENLGAASIPEADTALDGAAAHAAYGASPDADLIMQAEQLYVTNVAWIPLSQGAVARAMRPGVHRLTFRADQHISMTTWLRAYAIKE